MSSLTQNRCPGMKLLKCMVNVCLTLSKLSNCFQISHIILYFHRNIGFLTPHILDSICYLFSYSYASGNKGFPGGSAGKESPAMQKTLV